MKKRVLALLCVLALLAGLCGCGATSNDLPKIVKQTAGYQKWDEKVDYADTANWLSIPENIDKDVDVIYYYPTCYTSADSKKEVVADIDDESMRAKAQIKLVEQASVFEDSCNVFAPYYRQLDGTYALTLSAEDGQTLVRYAASKDATDALDYYFENYNNGRPFIIAGHSQGSEVSIFLLADYFKDHPDYYERMVAAYPIGWSVTEDLLSENTHLKFAEGANDTGVIVSWNTEGPENIGQHNAVVLEGAKSINPINWKTDASYASAEKNFGSVIDGEELQGIADAQIDLERGTLITNADKAYAISANDIFGPASFHDNDYALYYNNIKFNVRDRIEAYKVSLLGAATDYSNPDNWFMCEYNSAEKADASVDVIWFYGTCMQEADEPSGTAHITDEMRTAVAGMYGGALEAFDTNQTRIYSPLYRQFALNAALTCSGHEGYLSKLRSTENFLDVYGALEYYFENYNEGRPFVIAGYSQGGANVQVALEKFFGAEENQKYLDNMVAAYSIGYGVDGKWLDRLGYTFATGADDTGCVISWNTEGVGEKEKNDLLADNMSDTLVINPINWKTDETPAKKEECLGSYVDGKVVQPGVYNLQIDKERGSVICDNNEDYVQIESWGGKSLHTYELKEVFLSIRENLLHRIEIFLNK